MLVHKCWVLILIVCCLVRVKFSSADVNWLSLKKFPLTRISESTLAREHEHSSRNFEPYSDNGGTVVAIAGKDFVVFAADTRLSDQYVIRSRKWSRITELIPGVIMGAAGCAADYVGLKHELERYFRASKFTGGKNIAPNVFGHIVSYFLYQRRKLPYLSYILLGGIDDEGRGVVINFDVLGSFEELLTSSTGKGQSMIDPILDEIQKNYLVQDEKRKDLWLYNDLQGKFVSQMKPYLNISKDEAVNVIHRCFLAAAERRILIGDGLEILVMERNLDNSAGQETWKTTIKHGFAQLPFY